MELIERFRYIMKLNKLTASAFAESIGVQASSVSHILSGRNKPSLEFIQKVINKYPKVDATWLINGTTNVQSDKLMSDVPNKVKEESTVKKEDVLSKPLLTAKSIERILVFYSDGTFKEYNAS